MIFFEWNYRIAHHRFWRGSSCVLWKFGPLEVRSFYFYFFFERIFYFITMGNKEYVISHIPFYFYKEHFIILLQIFKIQWVPLKKVVGQIRWHFWMVDLGPPECLAHSDGSPGYTSGHNHAFYIPNRGRTPGNFTFFVFSSFFFPKELCSLCDCEIKCLKTSAK